MIPGIQPSALLTPAVVWIGILLALATFMLFRLVRGYRLAQERIDAGRVPERVRRSWTFRFLFYLDLALRMGLIVYVVFVMVQFANVSTGVVRYYNMYTGVSLQESDAFWTDVNEKRALIVEYGLAMLHHLPFVVASVGALGALELLPALPWLPSTLGVTYLRILRGVAPGREASRAMLRRAARAVDAERPVPAALFAGAAVEAALSRRRRAWRWPPAPGRARAGAEADAAVLGELRERARRVLRLRNRAARPSAEDEIPVEEARVSVDDASWVLEQLETIG